MPFCIRCNYYAYFIRILFYLSTILESKYDIHGIWKGVYLQSRYLYCHLVHIWLAKNWRQTKCDEEVYLHWFLMAAASVIIPLFIKGIYLLLLCLVIMGVGIGMALPCLDALITQGIEKEQRGRLRHFIVLCDLSV